MTGGHHSWAELDSLYTMCRRQLKLMSDWRYGCARVEEVAREGYQGLSAYTSLLEKTYCDLGCGTFHPFGISTVLFLNGAKACIALDLEPADSRRSAEALGDLLTDCICFPERWRWADISLDVFLNRAKLFDLRALQNGQLLEGIRNAPLRHLVSDIHDPVLSANSLDLVSSRATLEHFLDFETAMTRLYSLMRPGGVAFHSIDLVDHRAYKDNRYHYWSFLAEGPEWSDGVCNRLRTSQIRGCFERTGFEIRGYQETRENMPVGFIEQIVEPYRSMSTEELSVTGVQCTLVKPNG